MLRHGTGVWRLEIETGEVKHLTDQSTSYNPVISPDGKWVVYASTETGKSVIWKIPIDGGEPIVLVNEPLEATIAGISPDSNLVAYYYLESHVLNKQGKIAYAEENNRSHGTWAKPHQG
jgi:Tol biopolymer transport system component